MARRSIIPILIVVSGLLFSCGTGDNSIGLVGSIGGTASSQSPTAITTSADGAVAAAEILQAKELVATSTNLFRNLGFIAQSQMVSAASGTGTGICADYGGYDFSRTYSTSGTYTVLLTFSLCRENDFQYDGTYTAIGIPSQLTGRLSGLTILNFKNNYTTLIGSIVGTSASYVMAGSGDASNGTYTFTTNGILSAFDYYSLGQHTMTFANLATGYTVSTDVVNNIRDTAITANGQYSVRRSTMTTAITYADFVIGIREQLAANIEDVSMSGRVISDHTPDTGFEGVFDVATVTPLRTVLVPYPPTTTQGTLTTNATATIQYGGTNTIDVSAAGDATLTYAKEFMLMKESDFYAMEQQLPMVSGSTGTASGNVMSISALSTGPTSTVLNCYTDVHVSYFIATAPTPTFPDWYVHWDSGLSTCVPQAGIPYQEATSSTGIDTDPCDVGLDINGDATDITSGGVEHFLAASMPTGYYILSIDNYSCATTVGNTATVMIGDYLFGPYTCTYTSSDYDGSTPGAWCRLADVRVNAGGTIDVISPDVSLNPWHP